MKKSSFVVLTLVAALTLSSCAVQNVPQNSGPPDPMYADVDVASDTTRHPAPNVIVNQYPVVQYDYYYRSYFFDDMYRWIFPGRYYRAITRPGFVPRHKRQIHSGDIAVHSSRSMPASSRRGGFGRTGSVHSVVS